MTFVDLAPLQLSTGMAADLAARHFARHGSCIPLPGEYDANFRFVSQTGEHLVLKIMHPSRDAALVAMQVAVLEHLHARSPDFAVPQVVPTVEGASSVTVSIPDVGSCILWMLTWVDGTLLAHVMPRHGEPSESLGVMMGHLTAALAGFSHPAARRPFLWDLAHVEWIADALPALTDEAQRELVQHMLRVYRDDVAPLLPSLRASVIHGDANDYNVLVRTPRAALPEVTGLIDFGDVHWSATVCEPAVAAAYALLGAHDPLAEAARVVKGFHAVVPLTDAELRLLFPLICMRLSISVVNSACRRTQSGMDDPYAMVSERPAWDALARLRTVPPAFAYYTFRQACGLPAVPHAAHVVEWIAAHAGAAASVLTIPVQSSRTVVFDLSVGSPGFGADPANLAPGAMGVVVDAAMRESGAAIGVGRYAEPRAVYMVPAFALGPLPTDERRTVHMGIDLFADAGTGVCAPLRGTVHAYANNDLPQDYGPVIVLRHVTDAGVPFYSLYGHLSLHSLKWLVPGETIEAGQQFATLGTVEENGGWAPHLHFQLMTDLMALDTEFPGVVPHSALDVWRGLSPDPSALLGLHGASVIENHALATRRAALIGGSVRTSYARPMTVVRGWRQYLYDDTGRAYLDVYNNVPLVGHSHPRVAAAAARQLALLNTNTRYLHEHLVHYAERLTALLPDPLRVCYVLNSGSEANELALRLARAHTGHHDVLVLDHAYHGHTSTLIDVSPYKFDGPGGTGKPSWVHVAPVPDDYRGEYKRDNPDCGVAYAAMASTILQQATATRGGVAAFMAESAPSVAGQIILPPGYLEAVYRDVRAAGGVCIADEVQTGFGRFGEPFWGFETQQVVPDIVVLGKPIGNGFPLAAVITTPAIAASFDNGMEFFSTFGGSPVACAAGLAVLDVLRDERLPENAGVVGAYLKTQLVELQDRSALIGDVRGAGLFLGVELVRDRETLEPADTEAHYIVNRLRECGVLCGTDGPHHNVLKLRPPLCFSVDDVDVLLRALDAVLREDAVRDFQPDVRNRQRFVRSREAVPDSAGGWY